MNVLFLALLALLASCSYSPNYASVETCQLHCGDKGECPNGFSCSEGYCVRPGEAGAACFGGEETEGTVWLCQGTSLPLKTRAGVAQSTTTWQANPDAKLPEGVSVADDKLVIKSNAKLEYGVQKVTVRATDGGVTKDVEVALDVRRCLEVPELTGPAKVCRGEALDVPLKSVGGASGPTWTIQSVSAQDESGKNLESIPLEIQPNSTGLPTLVGDGLAVGSYEVVLEVSSTSDASWARDYAENPSTRTLKFNVEKCALIEPKCEPVAQVAGESPEGDPVFCVDQDDGIQINCSAKGADEGVTYKWNWDQDPGPEQIQLEAREAGEFGAAQKFVGRAKVASDKPWTGNIIVFVPDIGDKKTTANVPLRFRTARCPEMDLALTDAIVGVIYEQQLNVVKPDDSSGIRFDQGEGFPEWLKLKGSQLSGTPDQEGRVDFSVRVTDTSSGGFSDVALNFKVKAKPSDPVDPFIDVVGVLPSACSGQPYEAVLAEHSPEGWSWSLNGNLTTADDWLEVKETNPNHWVIRTKASSVPPPIPDIGQQDFQLQIRAGSVDTGSKKDWSVRLPVLSSCKFGFLATTAESSVASRHLLLGDLRQNEPRHDGSVDTTDLSADIGEGYAARGFALSGDGTKLTEFGEVSSGQVQTHVLVTHTIAGPAGPDLVHQSPGKVRNVSWSPDSSGFVAVTEETGNQHLLWAFSRDDANWVNLPAAMLDFGPDEEVAEDDRWRVVWLGNRACSHHHSGITDYSDAMRCVEFSPSTGFGGADTLLELEWDPIALRDRRTAFLTSGATLMLVKTTDDFGGSVYTESWSQLIGASAVDARSGIPDPSAQWVAQSGAVDNEGHEGLGIFRFGERWLRTQAPRVVSGCDKLRVWERDGGKLACTTPDSILSVADISSNSGPFIPLRVADAVYETESSLSFTSDTNWLVFYQSAAPDAGMMRVNVSKQPLVAVPIQGLKGANAAVTAFGPHNANALLHYGANLALLNASNGQLASIASNLPNSDLSRCDIWDTGLYRWCGSPLAYSSVVASKTGSGLAYYAADGHVFSVRPTEGQTPLKVSDRLAQCDTVRGCAETLKFAVYVPATAAD